MTLSRICTIDSCQRSTRALCICCQEDFCIIHLNEHSDIRKSRLKSFSDELNKLCDQLNNDCLTRSTSLIKFEKWRDEAHQGINRFYEEKKQEFQNYFTNERDNQKSEHNRLQNQVNQLIQEEETKQEDIDSINDSIRSLEQQVNQFQHLQLILSPLVIDDLLVTIDQKRTKPDDYLPLSDPYQTIELKKNLYSIAANNNLILVKQDSKLCLLDRQLKILKEAPSPHRIILDMFWSSTCAQFVIITWEEIFTLDEKSMTVKKILLDCSKTKNRWYCGACSNNNLFLSTIGVGSSILKYTLESSFRFVEEYRSPVSCRENEYIQDLSSNNRVLAIMIEDSRKIVRFELCSSKTLQRYWSIELDSLIGLGGNRCCPLKNDQWMVMNPNNSELLYLSEGGKLIKKDKYNPSTVHAIQLSNDVLAILTEGQVRLHKLS